MHLCSELQCTTLRFIEQKAEKGQKRKEQSESVITRAFRRSSHFIHISESPFLMVLHYPAHVFTKKRKRKEKHQISPSESALITNSFTIEKYKSTEKTWQGPTQTSKFPLAHPDLFISRWRKRLEIILVPAEGEADGNPKCFQGGLRGTGVK